MCPTSFLCRLQISFAVQEKVAAADVSRVSPGRIVCQQKESDHVSTRNTASGKIHDETLPTKVSRRCDFWLWWMIVDPGMLPYFSRWLNCEGCGTLGIMIVNASCRAVCSVE